MAADDAWDPVLDWYERTTRGVPVGAGSPAENGRVRAIAWLAAHRAHREVRRGRAAVAAVVAAVHHVLGTLTPVVADELDAARDAAFVRLRRRRAVTRGAAAGRLAAEDVLAERADDGPHPATWRPYLLSSVSHVEPDPPPGPDHPGYARDLTEVRALGGTASTARTPEQTAIARFWARPAAAVYGPAARAALGQLADARLGDRVELVALLHMVTLDALIAGHVTGERHPRWRPGRALGGPARTGWTALVPPEPGEPEYPCLNAAYAGAAEVVLTALAGHPTAGLVLDGRRYDDWRQLTAECVDAGVWSGGHLRTSSEAGATLGRRVALGCLNRWARPE